jgi:hypothetical protein
MIEIFKTNVQQRAEAEIIIGQLLQHLPGSRINFNLHDCDKILRIEGSDFHPDQVIKIVQGNGFNCCMLN